jgi:RNA polymerase sigma-70 factor, ECF subfamily
MVKYLRRIDPDPSLVDEVGQATFVGLLVGRNGKPPGLAQFEGRTSLERWVGISAQRLAMNAHRAEQARQRFLDRLANEPASEDTGPEGALLRKRYKASLEAALKAALKELTPRERTILRIHLVGRVSTTKIAKMYATTQATVSRWLASARRTIWSSVRKRLQKELRLPPADLESLLLGLASRLDLSLSGALASSRGAETR